MKDAKKKYNKVVQCAKCGKSRVVLKYTYPKMCNPCATAVVGERRRGKPNLKGRRGRTIECFHCKTPIWVRPSEPSKKFCSAACHDLHRQKYPRESHTCEQCGKVFEWAPKPFSNSSGRFCSHACRHESMRTGRTVIWKSTNERANAGYAISAAIKRGDLVRPKSCEQCGRTDKPIEAAHFNYSEKLRVRWLCAPCHRAWDHSCPKGGAFRVQA